MTDLDKLLASAAPQELANDPIMRAAFIVGLMAADIFVPVDQTQNEQAQQGGVTLMAIQAEGTPHVLLFSSEKLLRKFASTGQRFAKVAGVDLFPNLRGQHAILNPGPKGLKLTPQDIAQINGDNSAKGSTGQPSIPHGMPGHVHGPSCRH